MSQETLENSLKNIGETFRESFDHCAKDCENKIRQSPWAAVIWAAVAGFVLRFLPIGFLLRLLVSLFLGLIQPALVVFGLYKIYSWKARKPEPPADDEWPAA